MKVIDLIIAIANKEKVPYKIKYDGKEMVYDGNKQDYLGYYSNGNGEWLFQYLFDRCKNTSHFINDYVEVIEEDKEIEFEDIDELTDYDIYFYPECGDDSKENFKNKINELIRNQKKIIDELKKGK